MTRKHSWNHQIKQEDRAAKFHQKATKYWVAGLVVLNTLAYYKRHEIEEKRDD